MVGCGEEDPVPPAKSAAKAKSARPAPAAAAPVAEAPRGPRPPVQEEEFLETDQSRDPFRSYALSFVEEIKPRTGTQRLVLIEEYAIDELKLIGIVTRMQPAKAMLLDPTGKGHVVQRGQFVGRPDVVQTGGRTGSTYQINWRVDRIRDGDIVFIREDPQNPDVPSATRVIPLRSEGRGGDR
jgi:type IV pilus assembly protein PilP